MHFFFDVVCDGVCHVDRNGMHLPDVDAARRIVIRKATTFIVQSTSVCSDPHQRRHLDVTVTSGVDVITRCTFAIR